MTNSRVTIKDVYELVDRKFNLLETKLDSKIQTLETQVDANTSFRNQLIGKIAVITVLIGVGINYVWDIFINKR